MATTLLEMLLEAGMIVITSYSIHYTKLYEVGGRGAVPPCLAVVLHEGGAAHPIPSRLHSGDDQGAGTLSTPKTLRGGGQPQQLSRRPGIGGGLV